MAPQRTITVELSGQHVEGVEVGISESSEKWSEYKLEDGTTLRAKLVVLAAGRVDGKWDNEGNPQYIVKSHTVVTVIDSPPELRRKVS